MRWVQLTCPPVLRLSSKKNLCSTPLRARPCCRLSTLAFVSKRFARLCSSPELIQIVQLVQRESTSSSKLQALKHWLETNGRGHHVWCLALRVQSTQQAHDIVAVHSCIQA